ncbi:MAG: hypothetical protein AAF598_10650 [Bacteroidota bacterium]
MRLLFIIGAALLLISFTQLTFHKSLDLQENIDPDQVFCWGDDSYNECFKCFEKIPLNDSVYVKRQLKIEEDGYSRKPYVDTFKLVRGTLYFKKEGQFFPSYSIVDFHTNRERKLLPWPENSKYDPLYIKPGKLLSPESDSIYYFHYAGQNSDFDAQVGYEFHP